MMRSFGFSVAHVLGCFVGLFAAEAHQGVAFDSASATSTFPTGGFPAEDALGTNSGYWCSSGSHTVGERVTWSGALSTAQSVEGVEIHWAYGPGEFRILTSVDGGSFEVAAGWRIPASSEASHKEVVMFESPKKVKALAVVMRSAKTWRYFGINDISLLVQPGASMLVSATHSGDSEECLVASGGVLGARSCLAAIARGSGEEIFSWNGFSQLVSMTSGKCVSVAGVGSSRNLRLQDCEQATEAGDGRSVFVLSSASQVRTKDGDCLSVSAAGASVVPCVDESGILTSVAVPEQDPSQALLVRDAAALLLAASARQSQLLQELRSQMQACNVFAASNVSRVAPDALTRAAKVFASVASSDPVSEAVGVIDSGVGVDMAEVKKVISESRDLLSKM